MFLLVDLQDRQESPLQFALDQEVGQVHQRQELSRLEVVPAGQDLAQHLDP